MKFHPLPFYLLLLTLSLGCGSRPDRAGSQGQGGGVVVRVEDNDPEIVEPPRTDLDQVAAVQYPRTVYRPYIRRAETPAPALPAANNVCFMAAEVIDYDGTDGCGLMLETDEGALLLVGAEPRGEPLQAGTRISFGFEYMTDFGGERCPNADAVVRILCMRLLRVSSGLPRPVECAAYERPAQWLVDLAQQQGANYITRFPWADDRFVYLLETANGQYLYDCRGYLICRPRRNCLSFIEDYSQGQVIYEN